MGLICINNISITFSFLSLSYFINYFLYSIRNETFSFFVCLIQNEMFSKVAITMYLFFHLSFFTLSSLTHKITLYNISCRKSNVLYLLGRREYILKISVCFLKVHILRNGGNIRRPLRDIRIYRCLVVKKLTSWRGASLE